MSVPKQIQQAADQVAAIEQVLAAEQAPPAPPDPADVITLPPAEPPPNAPPPPPADPPPAPPPPSPPSENWEHKYKTLQGLFNSQMRQLQDQLRQTTDEIKDLKKAKPAEPPKPPAADPKDVEEFGADMVAMVERAMERRFGSVAQDLTTRLTQLEAQLNTATQSVAQTAEQAFLNEVERRVPNWKTINEDQRFLDWLGEVDPLFGEPRQEALNRATRTLNPAAAANVFMQWQASVAPPPAAPAPPPKPSLETQVAPTARASTPPPVTQPVGQIITQRQIERFYNELAQGKFRGRDQEAREIEAQINQALVEGRVR